MNGSRLGVVVSSGGSVVATGIELLRRVGSSPEVHVVTDRPCGMEQHAKRLGLPCTRIVDANRESFSAQAADVLYADAQCTWTCLFFSRLVAPSLYTRPLCLNVHPSLLPAYPGSRAVERLHTDGGRVLGATAHRVDATVDGGPIVAQVAWEVPQGSTLETLHRMSFAQKLYLFLCLLEADGNLPPTPLPASDFNARATALPWARPEMANPELELAYREWLKDDGILVP